MLSAFVCFFSLFVYIFALFFIYLGTIYIINTINKALFNAAVLIRAFSTSSEVHKHDYMYPVHSVINVNLVSDILCRLLDGAEVRTPPDPGVVRGHVG